MRRRSLKAGLLLIVQTSRGPTLTACPWGLSGCHHPEQHRLLDFFPAHRPPEVQRDFFFSIVIP